MAVEVGRTYSFGGDRDVTKYEVVEELNGGGFGRVFVARRQFFGFTMGDAILKVPVKLSADGLARFEREATLMANVNHPNVARVLSYYPGTEEREPVLVQERVPDARQIDDLIVGTPDEIHNLEVLPSLYLQALYALDAIHDANIVHRDVTLGNTLVGSDGRLKLIDFGLSYDAASDRSRMTKTGTILGTVGFIAPELLQDPKSVDHRADFFSLGKVLCCVLCGHLAQYVSWHEVDVEPWKEITRLLSDNNREKRYETAREAIEHGMDLILAHDLAIPTAALDHHNACVDMISERAHPTTTIPWPPAWPRLMHRAIAGPLTWDKVDALATLPIGLLTPHDVEAIINEARLAGPLRQALDARIPFELVDPLATMLHRLFLLCQTQSLYHCFGALVILAVKYHRFMAMGLVRQCFDVAFDPDMSRRMTEILDVHDPHKVIEGRGRVPGRD